MYPFGNWIWHIMLFYKLFSFWYNFKPCSPLRRLLMCVLTVLMIACTSPKSRTIPCRLTGTGFITLNTEWAICRVDMVSKLMGFPSSPFASVTVSLTKFLKITLSRFYLIFLQQDINTYWFHFYFANSWFAIFFPLDFFS